MPQSRHRSLERRIPSAPPEEELFPCFESPPPYSDLFPDVFPPNEEHSCSPKRCISKERKRLEYEVVQRKSLESGGRFCVYMDEVSCRRNERNHRKVSSTSSDRYYLEDIDLYPIQHSRRSTKRQNSENLYPTRSENGVTYASIPQCHSRHNPSKKEIPLEYALLPVLLEDEARKILKSFVKRQRSVFTLKRKDYEIVSITTLAVWQYSLSTLIESREITCGRKPHKAGKKYSNEQPENYNKWDPSISIPDNLKPKSVEIPGTARKDSCGRCCGAGYTKCSRCYHYGQLPCEHCNQAGRVYVSERKTTFENDQENKYSTEVVNRWISCHHCGGGGNITCWECNGKGKETCKPCNGTGQMVDFQQVTAKWKMPTSHHFTESTIPQGCLERCGGLIIYEDTRNDGTLSPVNASDCLKKEILFASENLVAKHKVVADGRLVREQSHFIALIPVYQVITRRIANKKDSSENKKSTILFNIIGNNRIVYAPNFSSKSCHIL